MFHSRFGDLEIYYSIGGVRARGSHCCSLELVDVTFDIMMLDVVGAKPQFER